MTRIGLIWDEAAGAAVRRKYPDASLVSFLWRDFPGGGGGIAWGEEGLDFGVTARSYEVASRLAQTWHGYPEGVPPVGETWAAATAVQADAFAFFQPYIRAAYVLDYILAKHRPEGVVINDDGSLRAAFVKEALIARGIPLEATGRKGPRDPKAVRARWLWPAMLARLQRETRTGQKFPPGGPIFWGQLGGKEIALYAGLARVWGDDLTLVAATRGAAAAARRAGIPYVSLFASAPSFGAVEGTFRRLRARYKALNRDGALWHQDDLPAGTGPFFEKYFPYRPEAYLISVAMLSAAVEKFIARCRPSLIIHASDVHTAGRLAALAAAARGIPTLAIQNHITGGPTFGYLPFVSSLFAAWGEVSRDWAIAGGASPDRVVVAGSWYASLAAEEYGDVAGVLPRRDIVVATNNFDPDQDRVLASAVAAYVRGRPYRLVFRPHPAEPEGLYRRLAAEMGLTDAVIAKGTPLREVLATAAVLVTMHSGVGVDAVVAGVPLVHVNLMSGLPDYIPYVEYGAAVGATRVEEITGALERALSSRRETWDEGRRAFGAAYLGTGAGDPIRNIAALGRQLLKRGG